MKFCCEAFVREVKDHSAFAGGGLMYPPEMRPIGQIEQDQDGTWNVNGCCGGGCCVLTKVRFCPFCGTALPSHLEAAE
jgi:hypothetical protein